MYSDEVQERIRGTNPLTDYEQGYLDGLAAYAWWDRGEHFVGSHGQTLAAATDLFLHSRRAGVDVLPPSKESKP